MKRFFSILLSVVILYCMRTAGAAESTLDYGPFGRLALYAPADNPKHVVLFISGDGGWNLGVVDMARSLTALDALVVGIDITHYLKVLERSNQQCAYFAGDLEGLSQYVQKILGFQEYKRPLLVGYSSGATLVYAALGAAPAGTFAGALSLGFCPDLMLRRAVCRGSALHARADAKLGQIFEPVREMNAPWIALHGDQDQVCNQVSTKSFMAQVKGGQLIELPKVGHGFSVQRNWMPQFRQAFQRIAQGAAPPPAVPAVAELPLVEVPAGGPGDTLAVLLTGDGGWADIDRQLANGFAHRGIPVVGWDSLRYLWRARKPEEIAIDLDRVLRHYLDAWQRRRVILVGYSLGAETLPIMAGRLADDIKGSVELIALLAPGRTGQLEFHIGDWVGVGDRGAIPLLPEVEKLGSLPLLCVYGSDEADDSLCPQLSGSGRYIVKLPGGHHFNGDYQGLLARIFDAAGRGAKH